MMRVRDESFIFRRFRVRYGGLLSSCHSLAVTN